jgi:CrcB protein
VLLSIGAGGALGSAARWGLAQALPPVPGHVPWATFGVNVSGCLAIGALMVLVVDVWPPRRFVRPFLGVGVLGGYTTFSTFVVETRALLVGGHPGVAAGYLAASLLGGLLAVWAALVLTRAVVVRTGRGRGPREGRS